MAKKPQYVPIHTLRKIETGTFAGWWEAKTGYGMRELEACGETPQKARRALRELAAERKASIIA